ncbi:MAG: hypothetical protein ACLQVN_25285 [Bryobacteraceae bacterium]
MKFTAPKPTDAFTITAAPDWPSVVFVTDAAGQHTWSWTIQWGSFRKSGVDQTPANTWDAKAAIANLGGSLTVRVKAGKEAASIAVKVTGANPAATDVNAYLATKPGSTGFDKLLAHESKFRHFNAQGEPLKSFDNGYGMCQLTAPVPTFDQVWNWKLNVNGGLSLFAGKRASAIQYLSQSNRSYTDDQLTHEAVCRWNGGSYHVWDAKASAWARNLNILCDSATGNIGWDMTDEENKGKTEAELHKRDSGGYSKPPGVGAHWKYSGVCYADAILG